MPSIVVNIAEAVVADFNAQDWGVSPALVAERVWYPVTSLKGFKGRKVQVAAFHGERELISRGQAGEQITVDIAVLAGGIAPTNIAEIDYWMEVCERIGDHYLGYRLASDPSVLWADVQVVHVQEFLKRQHVFAAVVRGKGQVMLRKG